jgi:hypothetical protein
MPKVTLNCLKCNNAYTRYVYDDKWDKDSFCSKQCSTEYRSVKLTCQECNNEFLRFKSEAEKAQMHYCSKECQSKRLKDCICLICKSPFKKHISNIERHGGKLCSKSCATKFRHIYLENLKNKNASITPQERFFVNISHEHHANGCWEWIGLKNKYGYGKMRITSKDETAHRFSYKLFFGDIPEKMLICHHCDYPSCVNPEHLFLGTHMDNAKDRENKNRGRYKKPDK